jgi:beta-lactam-binding protein with PASTA domain
MASGPQQPENDDDVTLPGDEWPLAEQYRVEPSPEAPVEDDAPIVIQQDTASQEPVRRFPPDLGPGLLLALAGVLLLLVLIPAGLWLTGRDTDEPEAAPVTDTLETTTATTDSTPTTPAARTVPDLTGLTLEEARALLEKENVRVRVRRTPSDGPVGEVLEQSPAAGTRLSPDTVAVLTVSGRSPPERVTVPSVEGLQAGEAASILRRAGLQLQLRTIRSSEPEGVVVSQAPGPDEEVAPRTIVLLEVAGPPAPAAPSTIEVPRLVGLTSSGARSTLRELGLRSTQRPVESTRPKGTVVAQSPRDGARLRKGQSVTLTVSTGPALVSVPEVVGRDEQTARAELEAAGFEVEVVEQATDVVEKDGVVLDQDPAGGASKPKGSVVTITIGLFESETPSSD